VHFLVVLHLRLEQIISNILLPGSQVAPRGIRSWYYFADQGLRQINEDYDVKFTQEVIDQTKELHLQKSISDLQRVGTKRATSSEIKTEFFAHRRI